MGEKPFRTAENGKDQEVSRAVCLEWQRVLLVDRIKDFLGLVFWGYLVYILQVNPEVKRDFFQPPQASGTEKDGPTRTEDGS